VILVFMCAHIYVYMYTLSVVTRIVKSRVIDNCSEVGGSSRQTNTDAVNQSLRP
jgi:hypothetical protein